MLLSGILSLGPGAPRSQYIPIDYVDIKIPTVPKFSEAETNEHGESVRIGKYDIRNGKSEYGKLSFTSYLSPQTHPSLHNRSVEGLGLRTGNWVLAAG